jgi:hypothetical protein
MIEVRANIFDKHILEQADAVCITTNSVVKADGKAVMGAGVAKGARDKWPGIDATFGSMLTMRGENKPMYIHRAFPEDCVVMSFPTKHHWRDKSCLELIEQSAKILAHLADLMKWKTVFLPRPVCSNGGLTTAEVYPILERRLYDRFYNTYQ